MAHRIQVEVERKYDAGAQAPVPDLVGVGAVAVVEPATEALLVAVYYDTEHLDVSAARRALRRRVGGADEGWHVKVAPEGSEGRTEHHWPLTDGEDVPAEIAEELAPLTAGRTLRPVARVVNRRVTTRLLDAAGYPVAEFCDDHVVAEDLRDGTTRRWREWEVELAPAAPEHPAARAALWNGIEGRVARAAGRPSSSSSKLARALGIDPMPEDTPMS
ncbi:MAG TPA: CYTH domain-containing protein [Microbacteriaceae bacterium]|nr:CYTH domain-containing protein [Microbacteriaceae bacterium]